MQTLHIIITIVATILSTIIPSGIALIKAVKARKNALTAAEQEKANADLLETAKGFIADAEEAYAAVDRMFKSQGSSAGAMKKDTVFNKLQAYALQKGYAFDAEDWSDEIDELVEFTKSVNCK